MLKSVNLHLVHECSATPNVVVSSNTQDIAVQAIKLNGVLVIEDLITTFPNCSSKIESEVIVYYTRILG